MADNSKFVLRWEIGNPATVSAARTAADSQVFCEGGFEWTAGVRFVRTDSSEFEVILSCMNQRGGEWECKGDVVLVFINSSNNSTRKGDLVLNDGNGAHNFGGVNGAVLTEMGMGFINNGIFVLEFHVNITNSRGNEPIETAPILDLSKFASPNESSNVTLVIGDTKLRVSKDYLAMYSPVFAAMFFGEYDEKDKDEIEIKEVIYEEFIQLLLVIFPTRAKITDSTVPNVLALGDRFQIENVRLKSEAYLLSSNKFSTVQKLTLADQFRLVKLRENCLQTYSNLREIGSLESTPEFVDFSDAMKAAICIRVMKLIKTMN